MSYKIVRHYQNYVGPSHAQYRRRTVMSGLTLEEAQAHCRSSETSSRTCTNHAGKTRTKRYGHWFDGFTAE